MSYSTWNCTSMFTPEQIAYTLSVINYERNYLACDGNYSVDYDCQDWGEPNDIIIDADTFIIDTAFTNIDIQYYCLGKDDIDWCTFMIDGEAFFLKIDAMNDAFGDYGFTFTRNQSILTFETSQRTMLHNDTRIQLFKKIK